MTPLRKRFIEDLKLHSLSHSTQRIYISAVRLLAAYYRRSPDQITQEELRQYFLYLTCRCKRSPSSIRGTVCGLKFFYEKTLQRSWPVFRLVRAPYQRRLPVVLTPEEACRFLAALHEPVYRAYFTTVYACGLRLSEAPRLTVDDVDSQRHLLHVIGKGNKERHVPLPDPVLCHRANENRPEMSDSKPATLRRRFHNSFGSGFKGFFGLKIMAARTAG